QLRIDYEPGLVIVRVQEGSPADEAGLQQGDLIKEVNRKPVKDLKTYQGLVAASKKSGNILFRIKRGGMSLFVSMRIGE
ncbi:MAG TPA: PDZ domain-containing protein, partial [Thermodesulfobacteriota bacterium]|nr:PDZ domain-containing protein [Thermodesulfobacteriota bacterium]